MALELAFKDFLFKNNYVTYLHTTREDTAKRIMALGLVFAESLQYSLDYCAPFEDELRWRVSMRRQYGNAVVVVNLPKTFSESSLERITLEEALRLTAQDDLDPTQQQYLLPKTYIQGYFVPGRDGVVENEYFGK